MNGQLIWIASTKLKLPLPLPNGVGVGTTMKQAKGKQSLADCTTLTPPQIADLLNFVLRSTYFQYNGSIYEQKDCAAMGSPLYMESF